MDLRSSPPPPSTPGFEFVYFMVGLLVCIVPLVLYRRRVFSSPKRRSISGGRTVTNIFR
ncbi:MAG: hypothetical protein ACFFDI_11035 [Promethearchaeota archaeon]